MLRWLKTVVVSDVEKRHPWRCQVGTRKMSNPEPLLTCRQVRVAPKSRPLAGPWEQGLAGVPVSGQVVFGMEAA
jgi:hypothetical protein